MKSKLNLDSIVGQVVLVLFFLCLAGLTAVAQTTAFTFKGNVPAYTVSATYEMEFKLFDAATGGNQIGATFTIAQVEVAGGFIVQLDFGSAVFTGADRFVEFGLRNSNQFPFAVLMPRKQILPVPYSIRSANATSADTAVNAQQLGGVDASSFVQTTDPRMTDARVPTPGSGNYIQNQSAAPQAGANFNIQGNGTVGGTLSATSVNAQTRYNIRGFRALQAISNILVLGLGAGDAFFPLPGGAQSSFFGYRAGSGHGPGIRPDRENSSFGAYAGRDFSLKNSSFGVKAGQWNSGRYNSFFGAFSGSALAPFTEDTGFFGSKENSFFGESAGAKNAWGNQNSFFGKGTGSSNMDGNFNSSFGYNSALSNTMENSNTLIGATSNGVAGITNATAIGLSALVTRSDSLVLGNNANVGIGTSAPVARLHIVGGSLYVSTPGQGFILKSPNGTVCRRLTISNTGVLTLVPLTCP